MPKEQIYNKKKKKKKKIINKKKTKRLYKVQNTITAHKRTIVSRNVIKYFNLFTLCESNNNRENSLGIKYFIVKITREYRELESER